MLTEAHTCDAAPARAEARAASSASTSREHQEMVLTKLNPALPQDTDLINLAPSPVTGTPHVAAAVATTPGSGEMRSAPACETHQHF